MGAVRGSGGESGVGGAVHPNFVAKSWARLSSCVGIGLGLQFFQTKSKKR